MIIIRHRTGPLAGKEQRIETRSDRITFGRDPNACDVVYPPDATLVGRRHFALVRKPSGQWTFDLFGDSFVAINGEPADMGEGVPSGSLIEIGRRGGPSFEVVLEGEGLTGDLPVTETQEEVPDVHLVADRAQSTARRARRFAALGVLIALLAAGGAGGYMYYARGEAQRLTRAVDQLREQQRQVAANSISSTVQNKLLAAAYVVILADASGQESATATASPIGPDTLATNAHVAEIFTQKKPGERVFVRAPGPNGKKFEVIGAQIHPGYKEFTAFLDADPLYVPSYRFPERLAGSISYDVGLLKVAPGSNLGPILEIASDDEVMKIGPGTPIAIAGYPLTGTLGAEVQASGPTPTLFLGTITSMTDMFNLPGDPQRRRLIHHNLPTVGGNSGSPIVSIDGKLIGLHNSGTVVRLPNVGQISSPVLHNFAQRIDLLNHLLNGTAQERLAGEREYWKKQTAAFKRGFDVLVPEILAELKPREGATPTLVSQEKFVLGKQDQVKNTEKGREVIRREKKHVVKLTAGKPHVFIAYAQEATPIKLYIMVDNKIVLSDARDAVWFPNAMYTPSRDVTAELYVNGEDKDITYTLLDYTYEAPKS